MNVQGDFDSRWTAEVLESTEEVSETSKTERPLMRFWERDAPEEVGKVLWFEKTRLSCACGCEASIFVLSQLFRARGSDLLAN
jgi:hypothetical protein